MRQKPEEDGVELVSIKHDYDEFIVEIQKKVTELEHRRDAAYVYLNNWLTEITKDRNTSLKNLRDHYKEFLIAYQRYLKGLPMFSTNSESHKTVRATGLAIQYTPCGRHYLPNAFSLKGELLRSKNGHIDISASPGLVVDHSSQRKTSEEIQQTAMQMVLMFAITAQKTREHTVWIRPALDTTPDEVNALHAALLWLKQQPEFKGLNIKLPFGMGHQMKHWTLTSSVSQENSFIEQKLTFLLREQAMECYTAYKKAPTPLQEQIEKALDAQQQSSSPGVVL